MAKIPTISRLVTEDFPDQKSWIGKLLQPLNSFMTVMVSAMNRGISFDENIQCRIKDVKFRYDSELPLYFANELPTRPKAVLVLQIVSLDSSGADSESVTSHVAWQYTSDNRIQISDFPSLTADTKYRASLLVF